MTYDITAGKSIFFKSIKALTSGILSTRFRLVISLFLLLTAEAGEVWGQDYSGIYYIGSIGYNSASTTTNYYLCPTEGWCYYQAPDDFTGTDNGQPFLTTYRCRDGAYDASKAVWKIEKAPGSSYYYIRQYKTGKYLVSNGIISTTSKGWDRMRVHLEEVADPATKGNNILFNIYTYDTYKVIQPIGINEPQSGYHDGHGNHRWLTVNDGNKNFLTGQSGKDGGPTGYTNTSGIVGIYTENDKNAKFYLEDASVAPPTFTMNGSGDVTISATEGTIYYTVDGTDPTTSNTEYTSTIAAGTIPEGQTVKAIAYRVSDGVASTVATLPIVTYHIVNNSRAIAVSSNSFKQLAGTTLSGYSSIPAEIQSPYIADETITFYTMEGAFDASLLDAEHRITTTPSESADIYVTYTTTHLAEKFVKLSGASPYNLKNTSSQYLYDSGSAIAAETESDTNAETYLTTRQHLWYFNGNDPYAITVKNADSNAFLSTSGSDLARSDSEVTFFLTGKSTVDATHEQITLKNISNSNAITVTANTVVLPRSYTLLDKAGKVIQAGIDYVDAEGFGLPAAWRSPLAAYHYWNAEAFEVTDGTFTLVSPAPSEITTATQVSTDNVIYVTYDVNTELLDLDGRNLTGSGNGTTYMLQFAKGESFKQEDGSDGVMSETRKAVYPYSNGDGTLYVYGNERWNAQLESGASTRTRWLWYLEPALKVGDDYVLDPYHVRVSSYQTQTSYKVSDSETRNFHSYLYTYKPEGHSSIVTGVTNSNPLVGGGKESDPAITNLPKGSEYMLIGTALSSLKLVTYDPISNGTTTERRTVNSFEQYWKNNPTVQGKLTTKVTAVGRNVELTDAQKSQLPSGWHTYVAWANSAPWVHNHDEATTGGTPTTSKMFWEEEHVFQTISMDDGSFQFVPTEIKPMLILLDQHGWEIVRLPLPSGPDDPKRAERYADIHKYSSPMVARYHFWKTGTKIPGYHKFKVSDYATVSDTDPTEYTADELGRADLANSSPNLPNYETQALVSGKERDWYVTYDVKPEYANLYAGAATETATAASPFLIKQGGNFAQLSGTSLSSTSTEPDLENVPENMQWYLRPNFDIDEEMGYNYEGAYEEKTKEETENDYFDSTREGWVSTWSNGFDPYNVQIQSVSNTARYFTANTTGSAVGSAWTGTSSSITTENFDVRQTGIIGHDQVKMQITNATFMVVDDGHGNMRLMPRFDNTKVMQSFTTLAEPAEQTASVNENQIFTLKLVPQTVHRSSEIKAMGGKYILASDFTASGSIGTRAAPFKGTIEGRINQSFSVSAPFIAFAEDAVIKNVIIESATVSGDTVGAIVNQAKGNTRIYNCGVNGGTVGGTDIAGSIVGHLDGYSRVINCYSYADITGGSYVGGIVGYNNYLSSTFNETNIRTMVMNCMFYGDITGGSNKAPIYNGSIISNKDATGLGNYNYFLAEKPYVQNDQINTYNCALMAETRFLQRFEFFRLLLNSHLELAAWYATGSYNNKDEMMKWVLETADRNISDPKLYPVLKAPGKYPSIMNIDAENAPTSGDRNTGKVLGSLTVNIQMGDGAAFNRPAGASITTGSLTLNITDKDYARFNFNYRKVQLPYYNDVGTKNYTGNRVVTGWKIVSITGGTAGSYTTGDDATADAEGNITSAPYNFADRNCTNKDLYGQSGRIFNQGAYWDVPEGVTAITIEPYWAKAAYLADAYPDVVYNQSMDTKYDVPYVGGGEKYKNGSKYSIAGEEQVVYTSIGNAKNALDKNTTVYDNAVVLVGNAHNIGVSSNETDRAYTIMSADFDHDNEPDYSYILRFNSRSTSHPVRVDFLNMPGLGMAQKSTGGTGSYNFGILQPLRWFESTNTSLFRVTQFEYDNSNRNESPLIVQGGVMEQWVSGQNNGAANKTTYFHVGGNVWFKEFHRGTHQDKQLQSKHPPVSVTGGDYDEFYLTGLYRGDVNSYADNAECYISGGRFGILAGAAQEGIGKANGADNTGNITWQIQHADIKEFYGGGFNAAKPVQGNIATTITGSHVTMFCGGPKFGDMSTGKTVTTTATNCTFGTYFGAGYGGNSYSRRAPSNIATMINMPGTTNDNKKYDSWNAWVTAEYKRASSGNNFPGISTQFSYQFIPNSNNTNNVGRLFVEHVLFSLATTRTVTSTLTGCTVTGNFYGGGSLGKVDGNVTSTLNNCNVKGSAFGAGFSASLPTVEVDDIGFATEPVYYKETGTFGQGVKRPTTRYRWEQGNSISIDTDNHILYTTEDLTTLGTVSGKATLNITGNTLVEGFVFDASGNPTTQTGGVFGGGDASAALGDTEVNISATGQKDGSTYNTYNVFGGGNVASVGGSTEVNVNNGTVLNGVYGGCNAQGAIGGNSTVTLTGGTVGTDWGKTAPVTLPDRVFGGGLGEPTLVNGKVEVNVGNSDHTGTAIVWGNVYGGSALGNTNATRPADELVFGTDKTTNVNLYAGTINGWAFGGGLGRKAVAADPENGIEAVTAVESFVGGDVTVTLDGAKVKQVFGANNLNGTPKGHVKVHVKRTNNFTSNDYKNNSTTPLAERTTYDVEAVYGGGNQADYNPTKATGTAEEKAQAFAEVLIEGCALTSIADVYGGGNAAAVPATQITINEAYIIDRVFGGGNGAGTGNPGADVGVIDKTAYEADNTTGIYGTGKAFTKLVGGQIHTVYGGSNTLGNVRGGTTLERTESNICELKVGEIYGAGQVAPMDGNVNIILECMPESFVEAVYGGAKNAVVNGNVSLTVTSGKYGRVFGGNNEGGSINGSITVNAYEDGCEPLIIGELYGGGYKAPYSIYGCTQSGDVWTANESGDLVFDQAANNRAAVEVNVYSCTSIGKVFGGGYQAPVIGNTHVWINTMQGIVDSKKRTYSEGVYIGKIGQVFGGGNAATVKGNTTIDIGTATVNKEHSTGKDAEKIGVNIISGTAATQADGYLMPNDDAFETLTAGIYGGGYSADVEGSTTLNIGTVEQNQGINIAGNIFGGGFGQTTTVTGDVTVNIGKRTNTAAEGDPAVYTYEGYANITGDVYGGSAKGKVNATKDGATFSYNDGKTTTVNLYGSNSITGNIYGGGLGEDNEGTASDYAADVYGPVTVNIHGGNVDNVFGCNNVLGAPQSTVAVNVHGGTIDNSVYGGGNQAAYRAPVGSEDYPVVTITNGTITGNVFGGGLGKTAAVSGNPQVTIGDTDNNHTVAVGGSVYGGGDAGNIAGNTLVRVQNTHTTIAGNVFGGGKGRSDTFTCAEAMVGKELSGNACVEPEGDDYKDRGTKVIISNGTIGTLDGGNLVAGTGNVYGGGEIGRVEWNTQVEIGVGTGDGPFAPVIEGSVFGAGKGLETHGYAALVRGNSSVKIGGSAKIGKNVYGGGEIATVGRYWVKSIPADLCTGETRPDEPAGLPAGMPYLMRRGGISSVTIQDKAEIGYRGVAEDAGHVFGAGRGVNPHFVASGEDRSQKMTNTNKLVDFANEAAYLEFLETLALVSRSSVTINGCNIKGNVYGGSESGFVQTNSTVTIQGESVIGTDGSTTYGNVFGGGKGLASFAEAGTVRGETVVAISDGIVYGNVYGGGQLGYVKQNVTVNVSGGKVVNDVYGGGALANTNTDNWDASANGGAGGWKVASSSEQDYYIPVKHLTVGSSPVYGYYTSDTGTGEVTDPEAKAAANTTYYKKLTYAENIHDIAVNGTTYKTTVSLTGGVVGNVYGGGLGQLTAGGLPTGEGAVKAMVYGDVSVTVDGAAFTALVEPSAKNAPVTGRVFGCNNVNGTPKGKVTVTINKTRRIDGGDHILGDFEIQGVYGGGNLSDYDPATYDADTEFGQRTRVIVNDCEASISKVYGGGNAAKVPFTDVTINGAFEIGYVFGGGNGGDMIYKNGNWIDNTGADVDYYTNVLLKGGTIGQAFGGSDSRGTVRGSDIRQETGGLCPLRLVNLYGAGNGEEASSAGDITVTVSGCGENNEIQNVYGGSYKANITGSVTLNIKSGIFTNVFGGNDRMGSIGGNITVNIEETDNCEKPIIIQNLYGGCYQTAYPGESNQETHEPARDKNGDPFTTGKITVNVKSATRIDRIFGGSERGEVTGDTEVNINMVKGSMSGRSNVTLPSYYTVTNHPANVIVNPAKGWVTAYVLIEDGKDRSSVDGYYTSDSFTAATGTAVEGTPYYQESDGDYTVVEVSVGADVSGYYTKSQGDYKSVTGEAKKGYTYYKQVVQGSINDEIGTIGDVFGGGSIGKVTGSTTVNVCTVETVSMETVADDPATVDVNEHTPKVLGAHIDGNVFGGCNNAIVTGNTSVNICTHDYSAFANFEGVSIGESIYGGGNQGDVLGNTTVTMAGGYVFDGVYGGGLHGSVGTFERTTAITTASNGVNHASHTGCVGKPTSCATSTGKCTVVVSGGQVGPVELVLADGGMKNTRRYFKKAGERTSPVDVGFVFGAGRGEVEDPATDADADFHCYVNETDVTIDGTALIMASVYGGGENGRVLHDTKVTIAGGQVGCGKGEYNTDGSGNPTTGRAYTEAQWTAAAEAVASGDAARIDAAALAECPSWEYGKDTNSDGIKDFLPYDPLYFEPILGEGNSDDDAGEGTDGHTYYGNVFGGGSGYYPFERRDGGVQKHDWLRSAGAVYGNTVVNITGGHILTSVYGGNEVTDVEGKCTINMSGGTLGVPRTLAQIADHPVTCYLFGAGKGDQRTHFNTWTNVQETEVNVTGGIIYGSVFGGGEDGHVLGNAVVNIGSGAKIGTWGTSYVDGNVFGGGRGFSGEALTAGTVGGNVDVNISGGQMLGSVYGGGRLASVGLFFTDPENSLYGQLHEGDDYGHVTIDISGGTIGKAGATGDGARYSGNVFGGSMGRLTLLDNATVNPLWPELAQAKETNINITGGTITRNVYGGGEFGTVREDAAVTVSGGTVSGNVFGGGYGSDDHEHPTPIAVQWNGSTMHYVYTPLRWAGMVGGNTSVSVSGGTVEKNVYGGGELASVGIIDYSATENASGDITGIDGKTYALNSIVKHTDLDNSFALSWPYQFTYVPNKPNSDAVGGKATVTITGGHIGSTTWDDGSGYVFGGGKGKVELGVTSVSDQRYAEAFCANVRETEVNINYSSTPAGKNSSNIGAEANCIMGAVYGGGEDGHVYNDTKVTVTNGLIGLSVYGAGKGISTYKGYLKDQGTKAQKAETEDLYSWTAGKVYGNTTVIMDGGHVLNNVYGGGYLGSVGKGNYAGGTDDYFPGGYGEKIEGNLWTSSTVGVGSPDTSRDNAWHFLNSGKATVTIKGGTIGTVNGTYGTVGGVSSMATPTGMVFGGSRGQAAQDVEDLSPRYEYAPNFYLGYVNETAVTIGTTEGGAPTIYGQVFGGGRDGHVRGSAHVIVNDGTIGQTYDSFESLSTEKEKTYQRYHRGNVYGSGSGLGTWNGTNHGTSSGSVTRNTTVDINGGTIYNNVYGGGAMATVGPPKITMPDYAAANWSKCTVNINGGNIGQPENYEAHQYGGCVYGASRGDRGGSSGDLATGESISDFATVLWTQVNIKGGTIAGNVYGGAKGGQVKKNTNVQLTGGEIKHNAYGGGQGTTGTNAIAADVLGGTTVELNKGVADEAKGCIVDKVFGCNDLNGTPKGHVLVHVYATQHKKKVNISDKYTKFDKLSNYTVDNYSTYEFEGKTLAGLASDAGADISAYKTTLSSESAAEKAAALANMIEAIADKKYDVQAVYGGGDLADYVPAGAEEETEVIIDGCEVTSIKQVYGGSNAASTPATSVRVNAAYEIHELFGGGNGYDNYQKDDAWYQNPGANVGYRSMSHYDTKTPQGAGTSENPYKAIVNDGTGGYLDAREPAERRANYAYGLGVTRLEVTGGRVHKSYGGSNENGNIRSEARSAYQEAGVCKMAIDETTGGSKNSTIDARIIAEMDCVDFTDRIFGGSTNADVYSDIELNITNGTFGEVYGGNNTSGKIYGSITVNVRENGCKPIIIGELYGGGYKADYSIYGYKDEDDGSVRTKAEYEALGDSEKERIGIKRDPQINVISATRINSIFGGGNQAKVVGSPRVNVNMEKGRIIEKYMTLHPEYATADQTDTRLGEGSTVVWRCEAGGALPIGTIGTVYGGGNLADVWGDTFVEVGTGKYHNSAGVEETIDPFRNAATITGNVFGGGKGEAKESGTDAFFCKAAMVGVDDDGVANPAGGTSVTIANGSVGGNVYGGGEIGRVEKNTAVTIGVEGEVADDSKFKPEIAGHVFGAGKGVATHGYSALVRGNSTVTIQGLAKVKGSVYGGGQISSVGRYTVNKSTGLPESLVSETSGNCTVMVRDNAEIGPDEVMLMTKDGGPDDAGHVFGAGQGVIPFNGFDGDPWHVDNNNNKVTHTNARTNETAEATYLKYIESLGLATQTDVTISGNAFIKGSVYGGSENGYVQHDTKVTIAGGQIGNGYVQMDADGNYLPEGSRYGVNRPYTTAEWEAGHLIKDGETNYASSLPECASWTYKSPWNQHDKFAGTKDYESHSGAAIATNGSTFYGNVFGGGSGYYPYAPGKWHKSAGSVGGNTTVTITGGHILTDVYGGNEMTNVTGDATINFGGNATLGVPRTVGQIMKHPVTCYLFGAGKGDPRVMFNKDTNVENVTVNITGGTIYGSAFGGGEDGHVLGNVMMNISNNTEEANHVDTKIGTWGTTYVDGNVFGAGRGFGGEAYTAGNVAGSVTMNISGGTMLGSVYGGGRLGTVGFGLYDEGVTGYGLMRDDNMADDGTAKADFPRGHVTINITGGTIGNANEFIMPDEGFESWTSDQWTTWKQNHNVPNTDYDPATGRLTHTKGGNVYAGGMGRYLKLDGTTPISTYVGGELASGSIEWKKLGNVKSTTLTISGDDTWIMGNVYGGGEMGAVTPYSDPDSDEDATTTATVTISGGTIGTEVTGSTPVKATVAVPESGSSNVKYTYGSIYGGGMGMATSDATNNHGGDLHGSSTVTVSGASTKVRGSVFGGGEMAIVDGNATVTVSGGEIGRNEVKPKTDSDPGYVMFGGATMGNVFGGGKGLLGHTNAGQVKGNTFVTISGGSVYHNVYGGGALASVGTFSVSDGGTNPTYIPIAGVPYNWTENTGTTNVTITGGTIGISGRDNGMVNGSSRGDIEKPVDEDPGEGVKLVDRYDKVAWVNNSFVTIGTADDKTPGPQIKGSVYGGGENGHNSADTDVRVYSGTIGIADTEDSWFSFTDENIQSTAITMRGNVYGAGCGTDTYLGDDGKQRSNPKAGMVGGNTNITISGGHIVQNVYGGGSMGSVGTIINDTTGVNKHTDPESSFALSWPYMFEFRENTGRTTINVTGGHIGIPGGFGGDVYGSARGEADNRYTIAHEAYVKETYVTVNYTDDATATESNYTDVTVPCIAGSVHGSGEDGYVYGDTHVTLEKGLIGHSLYGAGKGLGTYTERLLMIGVTEGSTNPDDYYDADTYSLLAGRVMGNTYVTMNGGRVLRNVYGGGNMGSVGKGNFASGDDDYYPDGYGEKITGNLWTSTDEGDNAWHFLNSGKTTVKVLGGTVGTISTATKNGLPYGNVFGGSAGEAAPNIMENPRYLYCPAFFSGYVNETDVTIGQTAAEYEASPITAPIIYGSVYGGGQDGHVRRDTKVTVNRGEIGLPYTSENQTSLGTSNFDDVQWLHRGNIYGAGSGISKYKYDFNYDRRTTVDDNNDGIVDDNETTPQKGTYRGATVLEEDYSSSSGSVTRFTQVDIKGGTIHRNVYGGGSMGSVGAPKITQDYYPYKKGDNGLGKQSQCTVNISGTIGSPEYDSAYGGNVFGAGRGIFELKEKEEDFSYTIWTKVNILDGAVIKGNVFGGGDNGMVKEDTDVRIGDLKAE